MDKKHNYMKHNSFNIDETRISKEIQKGHQLSLPRTDLALEVRETF